MIDAVLTTERLQLRPLRIADANDLHEVVVEPSVRRYLFDDRPLNSDAVVEMLSKGEGMLADAGTGLWGLRTHAADALLGFFCLWPFRDTRDVEFGFALRAQYRGRGYAMEAGDAMIGYVRDQLRWQRLRASVDLGNGPSIRTLWRLDFDEIALVSGPLGPLRVFEREF